jgi:hypothetical protein
MLIVRVDLRKMSLMALVVAALITGGGRGLAAEKESTSSPRVYALVQQIIDAYGGRALLENIHCLSAVGVLDSPMYPKPAKYLLDLKQDRKLRVEIRSGDSFELRILNGQRGYYQAADSPIVEVSGSRFLAMVYQFKELTMPRQLMTSSFTISDGGTSSANGIPVKLLLLRDSEGPPMKLYVDSVSGRILKDSGVFTINGAGTELSSEFHDFKKVDGRLLPFRIINYAGGQRIGELRIREYTINPLLSDALFAPKQ